MRRKLEEKIYQSLENDSPLTMEKLYKDYVNGKNMENVKEKSKELAEWLKTEEGQIVFIKMLEEGILCTGWAYPFVNYLIYEKKDKDFKEFYKKEYAPFFGAAPYEVVLAKVKKTFKRIEECRDLYKKNIPIREWPFRKHWGNDEFYLETVIEKFKEYLSIKEEKKN